MGRIRERGSRGESILRIIELGSAPEMLGQPLDVIRSIWPFPN